MTSKLYVQQVLSKLSLSQLRQLALEFNQLTQGSKSQLISRLTNTIQIGGTDPIDHTGQVLSNAGQNDSNFFRLDEISKFVDQTTKEYYDDDWLWEQTLSYATAKDFPKIVDMGYEKSEVLQNNLVKRYQNMTMIGNLAFIFLNSKNHTRRERSYDILQTIYKYLSDNNLLIEIPKSLKDYEAKGFNIELDLYNINAGETPKYFDEVFPIQGAKRENIKDFLTGNQLYEYGKALFPHEKFIYDPVGYIRRFKSLGLNNFIYNVRLAYIHPRSQKCKIMHLIAKINGKPYGSILIYRDRESKAIRIQWIFKHSIPTFFGILNPELQKKLPKLNEILIPAVIDVAKSQGVTSVHVSPIAKQTDILQNLYLFVYDFEEIITPCDLLQPPRPNFKKRIG